MTLDLCKPCAVIRGMSQKLKRVQYGVDYKITCNDCGRRRYGATYKVVRPENKTKGGAKENA